MHALKVLAIGSSLSLTLALSIAVVPVPASDLFAQGVEEFNAKRYHAAAKLFGQLESKSPDNQAVHLYMGKALEALKDPDGARAEYEAGFRINPFNASGKEARSSLINLSGSQAAKGSAPLDDPKTVEQTIRTIRRQTAEAKARYYDWANVYAQQRLRLANSAASDYNRPRNRYHDPNFANEVSAWSLLQSHYATGNSQAQAYRARHWGTRAAANLQESANNLITLMDKRGILKDDATLRAKGTNLYVRYYGKPEDDEPTPEDPPLELRAVAKKLTLPPASSGGAMHGQRDRRRKLI